MTTGDSEAFNSYTIRHARHADLLFLNEIELAAAQMLAGNAPESVLTETTPILDFETACTAGFVWIAASNELPVGFAHVKLIEADSAHLDELDVHPEHSCRGLGRRLVSAVCEWAVEARIPAVTLSIFRDVPWNMPFYASMGFEALSRERGSNAIEQIVADEQRRGLDIARRVVMRRHPR